MSATEEIPEAGPPTMQPHEGDRLSRYEQGVGAVLVALVIAAVGGGIAAKTQLEVLTTRVMVLERADEARKAQQGAKGDRERESAERLARIESKLEGVAERLDRIEREVSRNQRSRQ